MTKRTATYTKTALFCDEQADEEPCPNPAEAPCASCKKDLCRTHMGDQRVQFAAYNVFLCSKCILTTTVKQLESLPHREVWEEFHRREVDPCPVN